MGGALSSSGERQGDRPVLDRDESLKQLLCEKMKKDLKNPAVLFTFKSQTQHEKDLPLVLEIVSATQFKAEEVMKKYISIRITCFRLNRLDNLWYRRVIVSSEKYNAAQPVWHSFRPICPNLREMDYMRFEVLTKTKRSNGAVMVKKIAKRTVEASVFLDLVLACKGKRSSIDIAIPKPRVMPIHEDMKTDQEDSSENLLEAAVILSLHVPIRLLLKTTKVHKRLFFIRHGQSVWNKAQNERNLVAMLRQRDHPLDAEGVRQCRAFSQHLAESTTERAGELGDDALKSFYEAEVIFTSPLCRAVQTTLLALQKHPCVAENGIHLLSSIREVQNFGGLDSIGTVCGAEITERAIRLLDTLCKSSIEEKGKSSIAGREVHRSILEDLIEESKKISVNVFDSQSEWWTFFRESRQDLERRLNDFFNTMHYRPEKTLIVVGHSLIFRTIFEIAVAEPSLTANDTLAYLDKLRMEKLPNVGCVCLDVEFCSNWPEEELLHMQERRHCLERPVVVDSKATKRGYSSEPETSTDMSNDHSASTWVDEPREMTKSRKVLSSPQVGLRTKEWLKIKNIQPVFPIS